MKQVVVDGETPFLPEEIITNILRRLPAKSLIRFHCVCKHWKNLIKTPSFIADHLHHSSDQNPSVLFQRNARNDPLVLCLLDCEMQVHEVQNAPLVGSLLGVRIIGSSNGLLCIQIDQYGMSPPSLLLWNPAIRDIRLVPRTIDDFEGDCSLGFGFSPIVDDYRIVTTYAEPGGVVNMVEVYSLNTASWKEIELGNLEGVSLVPATVTTNGTIFWYGLKRGVKEEGEDDIGLTVAFDIATEVFTLLPCPAFNSHPSAKSAFNSHPSPKLTVYENRLAILHSRIGIGDLRYSSIELWVMEEGIGASEDKCSWSKRYTSSPYRCWLFSGTIWRNQIVCNVFRIPSHLIETEHEVENDEQRVGLFLLNPITNEFKVFANSRCGRSLRIFNYVESLVPVGNIHIEEH